MRIHDLDDDKNVRRCAIYLTPREAGQLLTRLYNMVSDGRVTKFAVADAGFDHQIEIHACSDFGPPENEEQPPNVSTSDR